MRSNNTDKQRSLPVEDRSHSLASVVIVQPVGEQKRSRISVNDLLWADRGN